MLFVERRAIQTFRDAHVSKCLFFTPFLRSIFWQNQIAGDNVVIIYTYK